MTDVERFRTDGIRNRMNQIRKAVILAAGFGTRLRPLTDRRAKPALPFFDRPLLAHMLPRLRAAGIEHVFINLHYNGWSVRRSLRSVRDKSMRISYSFEPVILGTAGVLAPLYSELKDASFLMINGDILSDIDFTAPIRQHICDCDAIATVVLHPPSSQKDYPRVGSDKNSRLSRFPYGPLATGSADWHGTFAGIHVIRPDLFRFIKKNTFQCINSQVYATALEMGLKIGTFRHDGYWNDVGTPARYLAAHLDVLRGNLQIPDIKPESSALWVHPSARIHPAVTLGPGVVIGAGCRIEKNVVLENVVVWPGCVVRKNQTCHNGILTPDNRFVSSRDGAVDDSLSR